MNDAVPVLPRNVVLHDGLLEDRCMGQKYPINTSAQMFLSLVNGKLSVDSICDQMAENYRLSSNVLRQDMMALCAQLSQHHLLNLNIKLSQKLWLWAACLRSGTLPAFQVRRFDAPSTSNYLLLLLWMFAVVWRLMLPWQVLLCSIALALGLLMGIVHLLFPFSLAIGGLLALSIALHETSHLAVLRWLMGHDTGFVACTSSLLRVVRPPAPSVRSELLISVSGPLVPVLIALTILITHFWIGFWFDWIIIVVFGIHILQLILPNQDIFNIFQALRRARKIG